MSITKTLRARIIIITKLAWPGGASLVRRTRERSNRNSRCAARLLSCPRPAPIGKTLARSPTINQAFYDIVRVRIINSNIITPSPRCTFTLVMYACHFLLLIIYTGQCDIMETARDVIGEAELLKAKLI